MRLLGAGSFGDVYEVRRKTDGAKLAMKTEQALAEADSDMFRLKVRGLL